MRKYLTTEQRLKILELKKAGMRQNQIAKAIGRSQSAVCYLLKKTEDQILKMKVDAKRIEKPKVSHEEQNLSSLSGDILFKEINWAIP